MPSSLISDENFEILKHWVREPYYLNPSSFEGHRMALSCEEAEHELRDHLRGESVTPAIMRRAIEEAKREDIAAEKARRQSDTSDLRAEHRHRQLALMNIALNDGKIGEAGARSDRLMALDGISHEIVKVERNVQHLADSELVVFLQQQITQDVLAVLVKILETQKLAMFISLMSEEQKKVARDILQNEPSPDSLLIAGAQQEVEEGGVVVMVDSA